VRVAMPSAGCGSLRRLPSLRQAPVNARTDYGSAFSEVSIHGWRVIVRQAANDLYFGEGYGLCGRRGEARELGVIVPGSDANLGLEVCSGLLAARRQDGGVLESQDAPPVRASSFHHVTHHAQRRREGLAVGTGGAGELDDSVNDR
jgi:hypothetical protein